MPTKAPPSPARPSVALTQDYLNQRGGSERVVLEWLKLWPAAPVYTLAYRPQATYPDFEAHDVRTAPLPGGLPLPAFRALAPVYPVAMRALGALDYDVVISSTSGWGHQVRLAPGAVHVVYCHTVPRWVHEPNAYFRRRRDRILARPLTAALRRVDRRAARRAHVFLVNSGYIQQRVRHSYGIDAEVVYPPVDVDRFTPTPRGERLLVVSRLFDYKRIDLAVQAANRAGLGLDVVGEGPSLEALRELAGPTVRFHGRLEDAAVTELIQNCRAVCLPGVEDFGIVPVEANAAGKPVVALAAGGVLETQIEGVTGALFAQADVGSLLEALRRADALTATPEEVAAPARRFAGQTFRRHFREVVDQAWARRSAGGNGRWGQAATTTMPSP